MKKTNIFSSCSWFLPANVLVVLCLLTTGTCFSQEIINVSDAKGMAFIAGDVSENQARQNALNEAKIDALKKAHVAEYINSYQTLFTSQVNNDYSQFFNSDMQSEIQGAIKSFNIKNEVKRLNADTRQVEYEVVIDAEVIKYDNKADVTFDAVVNNMKAAYNNHEKLSFSIRTTKDCYLTIFNITDNEASLMYPNTIEKSQLFEKDKTYSFPLLPNRLDYELETTQKVKETNRLIFVFTKKPVPYINITADTQLTEVEKIFTWLYSIMPDQRRTLYFQFLIVK